MVRQDDLRAVLHVIIPMLDKEHPSPLERFFSEKNLSTEFHHLEEFVFQRVTAHSHLVDLHVQANSQFSSP